jgi:tetratricopeptide (TPR) repeat protein
VTRPATGARLFSPAQAFAEAVLLQRQDRLAEAEAIYEALIELDRQHAGALHNLAMIRAAQGRLGEAASLLRRVLFRQPRDAAAHNGLGGVLQLMGRHDAAIAEFEQALALDGDLAPAHYGLGTALLALGRAADALAPLERALALDAEAAAVWSAKGTALQALGRLEDAVLCHRRALALAPEHAPAHNNIATTLQALGRDEEADAHYARALALDAAAADIHVNRGKALHRLGRDEEAIVHYRQALALAPEDAEALNDLGNALQSLGRHGEAIERYERALALRPDLAAARNNLANSLHALDRHDEAIAAYRAAIAARPAHAVALSNLGTALRELGRLAEARDAFERAVALAPERALFHLNLAEMKRFAAGDPQLAALEELARTAPALAEEEQVALHFALTKARADLGDHAAAFRHLRQANALKRRAIAYDEAATLAQLARLGACFPPALMRDKAGQGDVSERPVFIFGMPRSGSSLVEQILASHPQIHGAGELTDFPALARGLLPAFPEGAADLPAGALRELGGRYAVALAARAPAARRITDKLPANFQLAGLIHLALPNARLIHVRRDPLDTCWSCFATLFTAGQPFAYELGELGRYHRAYQAVMAHWRATLPPGAMLEIDYEDVVADVEGAARRMIGFCGLDWDPACLAFHATQRPVRTASAAQVRQPIYDSSIGRWRPYAAELGPLLAALAG